MVFVWASSEMAGLFVALLQRKIWKYTCTYTIFVSMKAKAVNKPRVAKTYRLQQETIEQISKLAEKQKIAESEVVEKFIKKSYSSIFK